MGLRHQTISEEVIQSKATKTADFTSEFTRKSSTAKAIELFAVITNVSGTTPSLDLVLETSMDGTNFVEQARISAIVAAGTFSAAINRADDVLGKSFRVTGVITGTTPSFDVDLKMGRLE